MTLTQWLARIERLHPREIELGLERIRAVAGRLLPARFTCPVITVAGTNGKGSTVTLCEQLARHAGYRTALYTSPHILRFNERIKLDGVEVEDAELCQAFAAVEQARGETPLTYFEFTTLAALWLFHRAAPDLVILEVGLGGRLDAVNIVDADVAVITSIGLDHQDWLGADREQIGREKAGILRGSRPLLFAALDMPSSIAAAAQQGGARLLRAGEAFGEDGDSIYWIHAGQRHSCVLPQVPLGRDNLAAAVQALTLVDRLPPDFAALAAQLHLPGRCQHLTVQGVDWYLDVGHNREALARFRSRLPSPAGRRLALCAMLADKPAAAVLQDFSPAVDVWYLAGLAGSRGRTAQELAQCLPVQQTACCHAQVEQAVKAVLAVQQPGDQVLVFGSFHTVAEAMSALELS